MDHGLWTYHPMRIMLFLLAVILVGYVAACLVLYFFQEKLIFHPYALPQDRVFHFEQPFEEHFLDAGDGVKLHAIHFHPTGDSKGMVIYYHGNGGCMDRWGFVAKDFTDRGYEVFMTDYRGYGKSGGTIQSEDQFITDANALYEYGAGLVPGKRIVVVGTSMGSGVAPGVAAKYQPDMLILNTPYNSLLDVTKSHIFGILPINWILKYHLKSEDLIGRYNGPVYIIHGTADRTVPYACAEKLAMRSNPANTTFITVQGGTHQLGSDPAYLGMLDQALAK